MQHKLLISKQSRNPLNQNFGALTLHFGLKQVLVLHLFCKVNDQRMIFLLGCFNNVFKGFLTKVCRSFLQLQQAGRVCVTAGIHSIFFLCVYFETTCLEMLQRGIVLVSQIIAHFNSKQSSSSYLCREAYDACHFDKQLCKSRSRFSWKLQTTFLVRQIDSIGKKGRTCDKSHQFPFLSPTTFALVLLASEWTVDCGY